MERWHSHVIQCPVGAAPSGPCGQVLLIGGGALLSKAAISTRTAMLTGTGAFPVGFRVGPDRLLDGAPYLTHKHLSE